MKLTITINAAAMPSVMTIPLIASFFIMVAFSLLRIVGQMPYPVGHSLMMLRYIHDVIMGMTISHMKIPNIQ